MIDQLTEGKNAGSDNIVDMKATGQRPLIGPWPARAVYLDATDEAGIAYKFAFLPDGSAGMGSTAD